MAFKKKKKKKGQPAAVCPWEPVLGSLPQALQPVKHASETISPVTWVDPNLHPEKHAAEAQEG